MFSRFFDLKENPFKLAYDPAYLFTGRHHEEAMAHLRYAVSEGEGFTIITGERGVGKSTICRAFLESLGAHASRAFLAGPLSHPKELMRRINQQFGIRAEAQSVKELIDTLNDFLMQQRIAGNKVVTIIDDAQLLSSEVLEQIRLLSNLETTREKLIQIILIGEPELIALLDSHELRQMGQRVSVCYEIGSLSRDETAVYIHHRLSLAAQGPPLRFAPAAIRSIFQYSGGNPRLINVSGQAVLAAAFRAGQKEITGDVAQLAIQDLMLRNGHKADTGSRRKVFSWALALGGMLLLCAGVVFTLRHADERSASQPIAGAPAPPEAPLQPDPAISEPARGDADAPEPVPAPPPEAGVPGDEIPPAPRLADHPPPMTHSVQTGAFRHAENAQQMLTQLTARGYPARISKVTDSQGHYWYLVLIGDYPNRQAAQTEANEFSRRENIPSVVRPYSAN